MQRSLHIDSDGKVRIGGSSTSLQALIESYLKGESMEEFMQSHTALNKAELEEALRLIPNMIKAALDEDHAYWTTLGQHQLNSAYTADDPDIADWEVMEANPKYKKP